MTRADLEAAAAEKYPHYVAPTWDEGATKEDVMPSVDASWQNAEADMQRAAYIRGRLDQAEADAQLILGTPGGSWEGNRFAAAIRKGVE
jgi:hypothetical protein